MAAIDIKRTIDKEDILFITAETGFGKIGLEKGGYHVLHPYNYKTVLGRIILELMSRLKLPQTLLFNKKILKKKYKHIITEDSIITKSFLIWLKKNCSDSTIYFKYTNMVGKAHHLFPNEIPEGINIWTYDQYDSDKYGINLSKCGGYYSAYKGEKREKKYDVMYVGKDKGRSEEILTLQKEFERLGLKTKFLIMPTTRVSKKKAFYSKPIPYEEVIQLVTESRAILNITLPDQQGATLRDYESIFNEVKLITTNKNIKSFDFYNENNIFVLNEDNLNELPCFVHKPYKALDPSIVSGYSLDMAVLEMLNNEKGV